MWTLLGILRHIFSRVAVLAWWLGPENGPAVGRRSKRAWRGLVAIGRFEWRAAVMLIVAFFAWLVYAAH
ncbi:hypothetical protein [Nocardioides ungokensis]|uniref:hypothetical protein n=1 Tax=Nocardioides ungokensis TaxID=1643322 RepID=UPI0015E04187|nr:hypothetical protein [Nocardioides ungokensis]